MFGTRRLVAVLAAYALALQALLAAFTVPSAVLAGEGAAFTLCKPDAGAPAQQSRHESCLACLAGHCAAPGIDRVASVSVFPLYAVLAAPLVRHAAPAALPPPRQRPNGPRAPPVV